MVNSSVIRRYGEAPYPLYARRDGEMVAVRVLQAERGLRGYLVADLRTGKSFWADAIYNDWEVTLATLLDPLGVFDEAQRRALRHTRGAPAMPKIVPPPPWAGPQTPRVLGEERQPLHPGETWNQLEDGVPYRWRERIWQDPLAERRLVDGRVESDQGLLDYQVSRSPTGSLELLIGSIEVWDRRKGIGSTLVRLVEDRARSYRAKRVIGHVDPFNEVGIAFWRARGYALNPTANPMAMIRLAKDVPAGPLGRD